MPPSTSEPSGLDELVERLAEEMRQRWCRGERPPAEEFLDRFPELKDQPGAAAELIYEEMCLRQECGPGTVSSELRRRFPQWSAQLRTMLDCQRALEAEPADPMLPDVGQRLGEFVLVSELGRGAQGRVYLATQPALAGRPVVLKLTQRPLLVDRSVSPYRWPVSSVRRVIRPFIPDQLLRRCFMKRRTCPRLNLQRLEDRSVPAVTASVVHGSLIIKGDATAASSNIAVTAKDTNGDGVADTFTVTDGSTAVGSFGGVTKEVTLRLSNADDTVSIDLGGLKTPRGLSVALGKGANTLTVADGTVQGSLAVLGGSGADAVTLGGAAGLTVNGNALIDLGGGDSDVLQLTGATFNRYLLAYSAETVTLDAHSTVARGFGVFGGSAGTTVKLDGTVQGDVAVAGGFGRHATGGNTLNLTGTVNGGVAFFGGGGSDTLNVTGNVGGSLFAYLGGGDDTATVGGTVTGNLVLDGGAGNDALTVSGTVGQRTFITGGAGDDTVAITATAKLTGAAFVGLGAGNDKLTVDDAATIATLTANGGSGTDTFVGTKTRTGVTVAGFES